MTQSRDFGPMAQELRAALERYPREELIDLMTHLLRVYVLEQAPVIMPELEKPKISDELEKFSFPQLLMHLQMTLDLGELSRFRVAENKVWVMVGDGEFQLDGPTPILPSEQPESAPALMSEAPPPPPEDVPVEPPRLGPRSIEAMRHSEQQAGRSRYDSIFGGGGGGEDVRPNIPMVPDELLDAPPPIAEKAPGDLVEAAPRQDTQSETVTPVKPREEAPPPPPPGGEKKPAPSNRFAALEFD